ncbi:MAG: Rdx family [Actinomycetota bacterium]|nr:Rdx family [Actinomycetota bacterium]
MPSRGGVFEVLVDGDLIHSRKATGEYADPEKVLSEVRTRAR